MEAREAAVNALDRVPFLAVWAFEFTPPSPESADTTYLRHVREADLVIWLTGTEVTDAVAAEIEEGLAHHRDFVVIRLGSAALTPRCQELFDRVKSRAKYGRATSVDDIPQVLELAMRDVAARALRGRPSLGRLPLIEQLGRASRARCVLRWQTPGLGRAEALTMADDPSIGAGPESVLPNAEHPVVVLSGEMGAGKSLCAERHLQRALQVLRENGSPPVPVWLRAKEVQGGLRAAVKAACDGIGDPRVRGASIVIDGIDEVGSDLGAAMLDEAREVAFTWPTTTILLTTRPLSSLRGVEELRLMPALEDDEAWEIVERVAGHEVPLGARHGLPKQVLDSMRRPLFALIYGIWQRQRQHGQPRSQGDLLAFFGERIERQTGRNLREVLIRLSVASVRRELDGVPAADVGSASEVQSLLDAGVVTERSGDIVPGLPVLAQWFAAQALLEQRVTISEILERLDDIDLWRYPLALAVATGSSAKASGLLDPLMREVPGFAFVVIDEALPSVALDGTPAPPWEEAGAAMRQALEAIAVGISPLETATLPVDQAGRLLSLGVRSSGQHVDYSFWHGRDERPPLFPLTLDDLRTPGPEFPVSGFSAVGSGAAWAWRWARDQLKRELDSQIKQRAFDLPECEPWIAERIWAAAIALAGVSDLRVDRLEIAPLREEIEEIVRDARSMGAQRATFQRDSRPEFDAFWFATELGERLDRGETELRSPLPRADVSNSKGGMVGMFFSDEQLVALATAMYENALAIYQALVARWFGKLGHRLCLNAMLPARFVGRVIINRTEREGRFDYGLPYVEGEFEVQDIGAESSAGFAIGERSRDLWESSEQYERLLHMRPDAARWITAWRGGSYFRPGDIEASSKLAYTWLHRDLAHLRLAGMTRPFV
ncbi:MAG TPA: hypothetical protein VGO48_06140 [Conexibacter sp.]|nr:hypothetical protein [Conexibacter sp.]